MALLSKAAEPARGGAQTVFRRRGARRRLDSPSPRAAPALPACEAALPPPAAAIVRLGWAGVNGGEACGAKRYRLCIIGDVSREDGIAHE